MNIPFYKYQGTGNDFVILDNRNNQFNLTTEQVKFMCDRRFGVGADGLMLLNLLDGYDFEMKYYNADGAESSMCGNGGRCLVKFAADLGIKKASYHFLAVDGPHEAIFNDRGWVRLKMKDVTEMKEDGDGNCIVDTGSPHYVKVVPNVDRYNVFEEGKKIRYSKEFKNEGINVNFVELEHGSIRVRTYERGVENETLSCGTGVTASAVACANHRGFNRVEVHTLGGHLAVEFDQLKDDHFTDVWLCGPATFVFKGEIDV